MGSEFSVYQFFPDDAGYEAVARFVTVEEAIRLVRILMDSLGARVGTTVRIIITDGGDSTVFEWIYGKGIVFPTAV